MSGIMTTNTHPGALMPGKYAYNLQMTYKQKDAVWKKLFAMKSSKLKTEYGVVSNTFGLVQPYTEGGKVLYQSQSEGQTISVQHTTYASGFPFTMEQDVYYVDQAKKELLNTQASELMNSFARTKEIVHLNIFNRAFNTSFNYGDTTSLIATNHTTPSGNQSNRLAFDADLSETSLENLFTQIELTLDNVGNRIGLKSKDLLIPPQLMFDAERIVGSVQQNDTANNAINVIKAKRFIDNIIVTPYLTDTDAYFVTTDIMDGKGFVHFDVKALQTWEDDMEDVLARKIKMAEIYSATCFDWRAVYGSQGI
jgi:hypothetical protein